MIKDGAIIVTSNDGENNRLLLGVVILEWNITCEKRKLKQNMMFICLCYI